MKTSGAVSSRAENWLGRPGGRTCFYALVTAVTFRVQPQLKENFSIWPGGFVFPLLAVAGIAGVVSNCEDTMKKKHSSRPAPT